MATATAPAITREILEERWRGLVITTDPMSPIHHAPHVTNSKRWNRLDDALNSLVYGLVRSDGEQDTTDQIVSELHEIVRENAIRLVDEAGIADNPS